jgi:hypothetical protein
MRKLAFVLVTLALGALFSEAASAHGRVVVGVGVGFGYPGWGYPGWGPYWGPAPYYYGPPVVVSAPPVTYIERHDSAQAAPASTDFWYYCEQSKTYYPYVKTCREGWKKVTPTPSE